MEFQYRQPQLLARLNQFLGQGVIARCAIIHAAQGQNRLPQTETVLTKAEKDDIAAAAAAIDDEDLKASLQAFGEALSCAQRRPEQGKKRP